MNKVVLLAAGGIIAVVVIIVIILVVVKSSNDKYEAIEDNESLLEKENKIIKESVKEKKSKSGNSKTKKVRLNSELTDYDEYIMTKKEKIQWSLVGMAVIFCAGYIFYGSIIYSLILSSIGIIYPKFKRIQIIKDRKQKLLLQFKEALYAISSSLSAGKSVPGAFKDSYSDLKLIIGENKDSYILEELLYINRRIDMNETIEDTLYDFSNRSGLEDIENFADIFGTCSKTGGNLRAIVQNSSKIIGDKIEIKQEINTLVSGKKFEARVLTIIPFGIVMFMKSTAPEFLEPLKTLPGRLVATVALLLIVGATILAEKIINIEV